MIEIVDGKGVGAGKSYYVLTRLMAHFVAGGTACVSESFVLHFDKLKDHCAKFHGVVIEPDQYIPLTKDVITSLHEHTPPGTADMPVLIVLDEVQDQLNARDWADKGKRDLFSWLCQSRHDDNDVIFISQSSLNIDKQIKRLTTYIWHIRNSCNTPILGVGKLDVLIRTLTMGIMDGRYFIANQLDQDGKTLMGRRWISHDKRLFQCYESKSMRGNRKRGGQAIAKKKLQRSKVGNPIMLRFVILICLAAAGIVGFKVYNRSSGGDARTAHKMSAKSTEGQEHASVQAHAPAYQLIKEKLRSRSPGWLATESDEYETGHLSSLGWVEGVDGNVARIRSPDGGILYVVATKQIAPHPVPVAGTVPTSPKSSVVTVANYSTPVPIIDDRPKIVETNSVPQPQAHRK